MPPYTLAGVFEAFRECGLSLDAVGFLNNHPEVRDTVPETEIVEVEAVREPPRAYHFRQDNTEPVFPTRNPEQSQTYTS